jgi:nucleoid-associated protein YgaU
MNVLELKQKGYRVSLVAKRYTVTGELVKVSEYRHEQEFVTRANSIILNPALGHFKMPPLSPRGGVTEVLIVTPKGQVLRDTVVCSRKDNYNRKIGNEIAIHRALSQEDPNYVAPAYELPELKLSFAARQVLGLVTEEEKAAIAKAKAEAAAQKKAVAKAAALS